VPPARLQKKLSWLGPPALQAAKTAVAAGASWFIAADVMGNTIPVFAPLAALLTVQVTVWDSVARGLQRVLGVVVGVLVAYGFARLAGINAWSIGLVVFVSLLVGRALRLGQQGSIQVPVSALLVLVLGATTGGYALDRVLDTMVGAATGILVNIVVVPPTRLKDARREVDAFATAIAALLRGVAESFVLPGADRAADLAQARRLSDDTKAASLAVERSDAATRLNPAGRRDRPAVQNLLAAVKTLTRIERAARGVTRALADAPVGWHPPDELAKLLNRLLATVAGEIGSWVAAVTSSPGTAEPAGAAGSDSSADDVYHRILVAARAQAVEPETAAIVTSIALDAHRISQELGGAPDPPTDDGPNWRALFTP
jgi:uncharacterized membrane protein YgaE (UPF0421/DUF939 family)